MAVAQGDPNRQIRGLQAGAGLFARLPVTLVHQKSYLASGEHAPLRYSLAQEGENRGREEKKEEEKKKRNLRMCFHPRRATPRCEGEGKRDRSTRRLPRL